MLPPPLTDALQRRTLALFIGADLPREVTGLPSRAALARALAHRYGLPETLSLAEVAQRVSNRFEFTDFLRTALDTAHLAPQPFHQHIVALVQHNQIETLITTAYDNLLELAFQQAGVALNRIVRGGDAAFVNPQRPTLIRLYGDASQPDTLVVTDRDHSGLLRDRDKEELVDEVRRALRRNTVFFLGYNLADPDFRFLFDQIAESRFARTAYAVWPGLPEADAHMWRERGIEVLGDDPLGILAEAGAPLGPGPLPPPEVAAPGPAQGGAPTATAAQSTEVSVASGGDVTVGGDIVGRDKIITNIYYTAAVPVSPTPAVTSNLEYALVRIFAAASDRSVGAGFWVGGQHLLTCAHVVAFALGSPPTRPPARWPTGIIPCSTPASTAITLSCRRCGRHSTTTARTWC